MPSDGESKRTDESRRILARLSGEAEPGSAPVGRPAELPADPVEKLGMRISCVLSTAITVAVIVWVVVYLMRTY